MTADPAGRCAAGAGAPAASGDIVAGGCGGGCRQSSVQISFKATAEGSAASVEIVKVVLFEGTKELETLTPTNPKSWNGSGYTAWDQGVAPSADIRSSYSLSAPAWSKSSGSFSKQYKVRITVKIGDTTTVIDSEAVSREAAVAT